VWNTTAKLVQQLHFKNFDRKINPFSDIEFKNAREARDSKRKTLQAIPKKRRVSAAAIEEDNYNNMINTWLQAYKKKNIYLIAAKELAWRGNQGAHCLVEHFRGRFSG
jgi:hypothetical protein